MHKKTSSGQSNSSRHHHHKHSSGPSWWRRYFARYAPGFAQAPYWGALTALIILPLFYQGGVFAWLPAAFASLAVLYALWLLALCLRAPDAPAPYWHPGLLLPGGMLLVGLLQLLPVGKISAYLSPLSWRCWERFNAIGLGPVVPRLTISPEGTWARCALLLLCLLLMLLLLSYSRSRAKLRITMGAIVLSAFANALLSFWKFFSQPAGQTEILTGAFLNRNHFAFMMTMGIFAACALLAVIRATQLQRGFNEESLWPKMVLPLAFMAFGGSIAQVLSLSRGAFLSTISVLLLFWIVWLVADFRRRGAGKRFPALPILVALALLFALQSGLGMLIERYKGLLENERFTSDTRWQVWELSTELIRDTMVSGVGLGAYGDAIQRYEYGLFPDATIGHAHNDWLELTAELGLPATLLLLLLLFWLGSSALRRIWSQKDCTLRWLGLGALAALLAVAVHECFDYNLQAMPNAMLFTAILTVFFLCGRSWHAGHKDSVSSQSHRLGWPVRAVCLTLALLSIGWALPRQFRQIVGARRHQQLREGLQAAHNPWRPSKRELQRLLRLADTARVAFPYNGMLLQRRATCWMQMAHLDWPENRALLQNAVTDSIAACRLNPANGDFLLFCAQLLEDNARLNGRIDEEQLRSIYALAQESSPGLAKIQLGSAEAARRAYWRQPQDSPGNRQQAKQLRAEALQRFGDYMHLQPHSARDSFAAIMELTADPEELLARLPENFVAHRELLLYLGRAQHYPQAFKLLQTMDRTAADNPEEAFFQGQERSKLLAMTGRWEERQALLPKLWQAAVSLSAEDLPAIRQLIDTGQFQEARQALSSLNRQAPVRFAALLLEAESLLLLGKYRDVANTLLPFAYAHIQIPESSEIKRAIALLEHVDEEQSSAMSLRERFLRVALRCLQAEQGGRFSAGDLRSWEQQLQTLEEEMSDNSGVLWLQGHLVPLFAGRIAVLRRDWENAAAAYRRSLALSPNNLLIWHYLQQLPAEHLTAEEKSFSLVGAGGMPIRALFTSAFALWQVQVQPKSVIKLHQQCEVEYIFLCLGDIQEEGKAMVTFSTPYGDVFSDSFSAQEIGISALNLKVGEIMHFRRTYQPLLKIATRGQPLRSCKLSARIVMQSQQRSVNRSYAAIPPAEFAALEIKHD